MATRTKKSPDYLDGYSDYRNGRDYHPPGGSWDYSDGWDAAQEEAENKYGRASACYLSRQEGGIARYETRAMQVI